MCRGMSKKYYKLWVYNFLGHRKRTCIIEGPCAQKYPEGANAKARTEGDGNQKCRTRRWAVEPVTGESSTELSTSKCTVCRATSHCRCAVPPAHCRCKGLAASTHLHARGAMLGMLVPAVQVVPLVPIDGAQLAVRGGRPATRVQPLPERHHNPAAPCKLGFNNCHNLVLDPVLTCFK
jgi:hypothetical protein